MNAQLTEMMHLITNQIRTGTVTEVGWEYWMCPMKMGDLENNWIHWLTTRGLGLNRPLGSRLFYSAWTAIWNITNSVGGLLK